jgi:hypothetical protein
MCASHFAIPQVESYLAAAAASVRSVNKRRRVSAPWTRDNDSAFLGVENLIA